MSAYPKLNGIGKINVVDDPTTVPFFFVKQHHEAKNYVSRSFHRIGDHDLSLDSRLHVGYQRIRPTRYRQNASYPDIILRITIFLYDTFYVDYHLLSVLCDRNDILHVIEISVVCYSVHIQAILQMDKWKFIMVSVCC